jgi:uncharacterized membrane protein
MSASLVILCLLLAFLCAGAAILIAVLAMALAAILTGESRDPAPRPRSQTSLLDLTRSH